MPGAVKTGLAFPWVAKYTDNGDGTVTYSGGMRLGKAINTSFEYNSGNNNILYADNAPSEVDHTFAGGTLKAEIDALPIDGAKLILGLNVEEIPAATDPVPVGAMQAIDYDDDQAAPYVGYAVVVSGQLTRDGVTNKYWIAFISPKVMFKLPNDTFVTKGSSITWGTDSLEADILRDDTPKHLHKRHVICESEADAISYIKTFFEIEDDGEELEG